MSLETKLLDYELPEELIAQEPPAVRCDSRMMVLHRNTNEIEHRRFSDIADYMESGDLLVVNDSRVFPARLFVRKKTGGTIELLFQRQSSEDGNLWEALARPGRRLREGMPLYHDAVDGPFCIAEKNLGGGPWLIRIKVDSLIPFLEEHGIVPLPPYVKKELGDAARYQTVYARDTGSTAAPTAGMHFTDELISRLKEKSISIAKVTLHIGMDTFRPISADLVQDHEMHTEFCRVPQGTADAISSTKEKGGRVIAVGTTSVRTIESMAAGKLGNDRGGHGEITGCEGNTDLFIYNRDQFRLVDCMLTNFHLPRTTLLAMVCAFGGRGFMLSAYREAVNERYRFFSFGDCMLIL